MKQVLLLYLLVITNCIAIKAFAAHIFVVESYHAEYLWDIEYKKGLTDYLGKNHRFSYFQMDTKRILKAEIKNKANLAWQKILELKPDVVVLADDNALKSLIPRLKNTTIPVVYLGINNNPRNYHVEGAKNVTGILERPLFKRSILYTQKILPKAKKGLILFDTGATSYAALNNEFAKKTK